MNSESKLLLDIPEVCDRTSLGRSRIYEEIGSGRLKIVKVGARTLVSVDALKEWIASLEVSRAHTDDSVRGV